MPGRIRKLPFPEGGQIGREHKRIIDEVFGSSLSKNATTLDRQVFTVVPVLTSVGYNSHNKNLIAGLSRAGA